MCSPILNLHWKERRNSSGVKIRVFSYLCCPKKGPVAEGLGRALQKLVQRFESARDLDKTQRHPSGKRKDAFIFSERPPGDSLIGREEKIKQAREVSNPFYRRFHTPFEIHAIAFPARVFLLWGKS
jgi:hypothetical protein